MNTDTDGGGRHQEVTEMEPNPSAPADNHDNREGSDDVANYSMVEYDSDYPGNVPFVWAWTATEIKIAYVPATWINTMFFQGLIKLLPKLDMFGVSQDAGEEGTAAVLKWLDECHASQGFPDDENDDKETLLEYLPTLYDNVEEADRCFCMSDYDDREHFAVFLPCEHVFGESCLKSWFFSSQENRNRCPMCRRKLFETPTDQ